MKSGKALAVVLVMVCAGSGAGADGEEWSAEVETVSIEGSVDGASQSALFWQAKGKAPLLVALHTWSADYRQAGSSVPYWRWCEAQGWHFIQPDFRGRNGTPESMGSALAVQDVVDAVRFAQGVADVDGQRIYLIGVSGGGHMAMLMAGQHPEIWAGVSAWCGIADISRWHAECAASGSFQRYAADIEKTLGGVPVVGSALAEQAWGRSPLSVVSRARGLAIDVAAGVHDGREGSVPFSHSLRAFNELAEEGDRLSDGEVADIYESQEWSGDGPAVEDAAYAPRAVRFRRQSGQARVTIFEGGHEILHVPALNWLALQRKGEPAVWDVEEVLPVPGADVSESGL